MEKNVNILDVNGNEIGKTYPKRAKGLVKNGRAVYVSDCVIRLLHTIPTTIEFDNGEGDITMSNVLCFNARDFKFDKSCENNVGSRMFITDMFGESVEVYEIGDGKDDVTQIQAIKTLEKETDYTFRFALTTSKDFLEGVTQFMIVPIAGEEETEDDWENRYIFNLSQNQYKAAVTKLWGINLIRVYEIPFNTADVTKFRLVFMNKHSVARIYPAREIESYSSFQDFSYAGWLNDKKEQIEKSVKEFDLDKTIKSATEATKKAADVVTEKLKSAYEGISNTVRNATASESTFENHKNENLDENQLAAILAKMGDGCNLNISNCNLTDACEKTVDQGGAKDGLNILACNANIGGKSFATLLSKIGDGSNIDLSNSNIAELALTSTFVPADGVNVVIKNSSISSSSFATLMSVVGSGSNVDLGGSVIVDDGSDFSFGEVIEGANIRAMFATVPDGIKEKLHLKLGLGSVISGI